MFVFQGNGVEVQIAFLYCFYHRDDLFNCHALFFEPVYDVSPKHVRYFVFFVQFFNFIDKPFDFIFFWMERLLIDASKIILFFLDVSFKSIDKFL